MKKTQNLNLNLKQFTSSMTHWKARSRQMDRQNHNRSTWHGAAVASKQWSCVCVRAYNDLRNTSL